MDKVDKYINSVYKNVSASSDEIDIMKEEMKYHLQQSINELKEEGKSEEESIDTAISRFGEVDEIKQQLANVYAPQRKFSKIIFSMAILFLMFATVALIFNPIMDKIADVAMERILSNITETIVQDNGIAEEKMKSLFDQNEKNFIGSGRELKYISIFKYPKDFSGKVGGGYLSYKNAKYIYPGIDVLDEDLRKNGYISNSCLGKEISVNGNKWFISVEYISSETNYNIIFAACLTAYWMLFGVWATINAYNSNGPNFGWFISFFIFNAFAYILFKLKNRKQMKMER